jgi:hypothetical protein
MFEWVHGIINVGVFAKYNSPGKFTCLKVEPKVLCFPKFFKNSLTPLSTLPKNPIKFISKNTLPIDGRGITLKLNCWWFFSLLLYIQSILMEFSAISITDYLHWT